MKISAAFSLLWDLIDAGQMALIPTIKDIICSPSLILRPHVLSRIFMAHVWANGFAVGTDERARPVKEGLITPNAFGTVLDLGAGHGHAIPYLDRTKVKKYVAVEPNTLMHPEIRKAAEAAAFYESDGSLVILSCGAEDSLSILSALSASIPSETGAPSEPKVDTIISILTLCTIPHPEKTVHTLVRDVLSSDGQFLFYEHVLSHREDVAWWQRFWAPLWQIAFDGCRMDRPSHLVVENLKLEGTDGEGSGESPWKEGKIWGKPDESEENVFWHRAGRFVKK